VLSEQLLDLFPEESLFRCDHYLHKQLVQTLTTLRFGNAIYEPLWNREHISCVMITMKEAIGTEGRGGYFDGIGIIRDVVQNHLLQVLSLIAMEAPASHDSEDVRDAKTELLKCIREISTSEVVLGQFEGWVKKEPSRKITQLGYLDEDGVPADSKCATFATLVLEIDNDRWRGVPFIIKAGKALNERKTEVRIQFKPPRTQVFDPATLARNELVLRVQPKEAVYMKIVSKRPSLADKLIETELDLSFGDRYSGVRVPEAYERLIYNVLKGRRELFVRSDELREAWKLFTPLLNRIDAGEVEVHKYPFGSRGPEASDELIKRHGYVRSETYTWKK
jgi:glucose-6-phosphate 1-dehydrogenase